MCARGTRAGSQMSDTNPFAAFAFGGDLPNAKLAAQPAPGAEGDAAQPARKKHARAWMPVKLEESGETAGPVACSAAVAAEHPARPRKMSSKYARYIAGERNGKAEQKCSSPGAVRSSDSSNARPTAAPMGGALVYGPDVRSATTTTSTCSTFEPTASVLSVDKSEVQAGRAGWRAVFDTIRRHRAERDATVDAFHQYLLELRSEPEGDFLVLVAGLLSVQARDNVAMAAMRRLRATFGDLDNGAAEQSQRGLCVDAVCRMPLEQLEQLLNTLNFFRTKAGYIKGCAEALQRYPHNGRVPRTQQKLQKLPGVGPKVALLILSVGFAQGDAGIVVDTHVHRVATRLGWAKPPNAVRAAFSGASFGSSAEGTRAALQSFVPADEWPDFTTIHIGFGQKTCLAQKPRCHECPVAGECPSADLHC